MKKWLFLVCLGALTACSEADDTIDEYANWQERNELFFEQQYQAYNVKYASWTKAGDKLPTELPHTNCILVEEIERNTEETTSPYYTDSVEIHYEGRLIPSASYKEGYVFDRSFLPPFDIEVDAPTTLAVNSVVDGFSTALQHMHRGDYWRVIVPYQLGYNKEEKTEIPAYSTLVFYIWLVDFWHEKPGDRDE
jgi:FKBP-type peptidyl-prolyl cis-trans isomerase FklB